MSKIEIKTAEKAEQARQGHEPAQQSELSEEDKSKDTFFIQVAEIAEAMIARHGKDFAIGALVLSAKFIAEGKPLINRANGGRERAGTVKPV
jgi:hypothetical protein